MLARDSVDNSLSQTDQFQIIFELHILLGGIVLELIANHVSLRHMALQVEIETIIYYCYHIKAQKVVTYDFRYRSYCNASPCFVAWIRSIRSNNQRYNDTWEIQ